MLLLNYLRETTKYQYMKIFKIMNLSPTGIISSFPVIKENDLKRTKKGTITSLQ